MSNRRSLQIAECVKVRNMMFLLTTNEADEESARAAFLHLADCPTCREALAEHVRLTAALFGTLGQRSGKG